MKRQTARNRQGWGAKEASPWDFVFVLEESLGHSVHALNIENVLTDETDISATVIPIRSSGMTDVRRIPLIDNWSVQASWAARTQLRRELARHRPDALFIHTQVASLFSCRMMRQVPTVVSLDATPINFDTMAEPYEHPRQSAPTETFKTWVNRRAMVAAEAIVTWSQWAADSVIRDYGIAPDRVHVIHPGVNLSRFHPSDQEREPGPVRLLFVGGDFERKGGTDLLQIMHELDGSAELDIVSSAAVVPSGLPVRVHSSVTGNSMALTDLYRRADIFVLPSRGDCLSLAIAEAMASGLPVVACPVGGVAELVVGGANGLLVPPRDPQQLLTALTTLIDSPELRRVMGARSREIAEANHDAIRNFHRIFELMRSISRRRSPRLGAEATMSPDGTGNPGAPAGPDHR